jgi:hypothetical protein
LTNDFFIKNRLLILVKTLFIFYWLKILWIYLTPKGKSLTRIVNRFMNEVKTFISALNKLILQIWTVYFYFDLEFIEYINWNPLKKLCV